MTSDEMYSVTGCDEVIVSFKLGMNCCVIPSCQLSLCSHWEVNIKLSSSVQCPKCKASLLVIHSQNVFYPILRLQLHQVQPLWRKRKIAQQVFHLYYDEWIVSPHSHPGRNFNFAYFTAQTALSLICFIYIYILSRHKQKNLKTLFHFFYRPW